MTKTTKVKAVHSIRMRKPGTGVDGKPVEFLDIPPNGIFDCPNDALKELRASGAITSLSKLTPSEAREEAAESEDADEADETDADETEADDADSDQAQAPEKTEAKPVEAKKAPAKKAPAKKAPAKPASDPDDVM